MKKRWFIRLEWKVQDCWVGVFWRNGPHWLNGLDVWVCLLPMLPIHFGWAPTVEHG